MTDADAAGSRTPHRGAAPYPDDAGAGLPGVVVAGVTALVSGVSVFVNSYGVHAVRQPALYTTAKNLVAAVGLGVVALVAASRRGRGVGLLRRFATSAPGVVGSTAGPEAGRARRLSSGLGLAYVGVVGGGLAFVLFFDGLADTTAAPAAFWHDTLVIWVAALALPVLGERARWWNGAAIALLVLGQVVLEGGVGRLAADRGELLVLGATLLWSVEVVVAKRLLGTVSPARLGLVRMGVGTLTLVVYVAATGSLRALVAMDAVQQGWVVLTGLLLAAYVATWMSALARGRAVDVTSVLVGGALVTWLLQAAAGTAPPAPDALGVALIAAGTAVVAVAGWRRSRFRPAVEDR